MAVPATLSSVPDVTPVIQYTATGGQTVFPYPFPITEDADLVVVINGATQATDSTYSVSGVGNSTGGNCTLNSGANAGDIVTLYRDIAIERISQIAQNSGFSSTVFNNEFNNFYLIAQQLEASISLCLQIPSTNNPAPTTLITPANYANKVQAYDGNGNPIPGPSTIIPTSVSTQANDVRNYGAKLDGSTDDTTAVANCLAANGSAFVPYTASGIVLNNLTVSGQQTLNGAGRVQMYAKPGANYAVRMCGYGPSISGFMVQDTGTTTAQSTCNGGASAGNTSIVVSNASPGPAFQAGQRIAIELASGLWHCTYISSMSGTTVNLVSAIPTGQSVPNGARVWASFGFIYVTTNNANTQMVTIKDFIWNTTYAGILMDSPNNSYEIADCYIDNAQWPGSGRMFMIVCGRNANNNNFANSGGFGGWNTSASFTGNASTTQFSFPDNIFLTREATVTVNGVAQTLGVGYSWASNSNRTVTLTSAPGAGVVVALSGYTYGCEGFVNDPTGSSQPTGGNNWINCTSLQFQRGWNFRNAQLWSFSNTIGDTCSDAAYCFDASSGSNAAFNGAFIGWAASGIKLINSAQVVLGVQTWSAFPAGTQVYNSGSGGTSGAVENLMSVDATSDLQFGRSTWLLSCSTATVASSSTVYFGPSGQQSVVNAGQWLVPYACFPVKLDVQCASAPGSGQTYTYTVLDINLNVLATATISGASTYGAQVYIPAQSLTETSAVTVKLVTSSGATAGYHRVGLAIEPQ